MVKEDKNFIQFLGTGAADSFDSLVQAYGKPKANKEGRELLEKYRCLGGRNIRQFSSLFISPDILIDFSSEKQMRAYGVRKEVIRHLLITHPHYDHFQPVAIQEFSAGLPHRLKVYGSNAVIDSLEFAKAYRWDSYSVGTMRTNKDNSNIQARAVGHGETFFLGKTRVTSVWSNHGIGNEFIENLIFGGQALNFVLERKGKALFYGLDSSYVLPGTFKVLSRFQFDIAIFDATFGQLKSVPAGCVGHQTFTMLKKTIAQFRQANMFQKNAVIVADHLSLGSVTPHDEIVDALARDGITLAYDGMVVEF